MSYAAIKLYSGLVWNRCTVFTVCAMCNKIFHAWLREFTRYLDAWFYLLYLHPIFTREEFLDEKLILILTNMPSVSFIIVIITITHVCCVYSRFISLFYFYFMFSDTLMGCLKVMLLQGIGANGREWCQHRMVKVDVKKIHMEGIDPNV